MGARAVIRLSRIHIGRLVTLEVAVAAATLAMLARSDPVRLLLFAAAAAVAMLTIVRVRRRPLSAWLATAAAWLARSWRRSTTSQSEGCVLAERDGLVAVLEIGDSDSVVVRGDLRLPPIAAWPPLPRRRAPVRIQLLVLSTSATTRVLIALRAQGGAGWHADAPRAALESAVRRIGHHLSHDRIAFRRLERDELASAAGTREPWSEAWDHIRTAGRVHATLRLPLGADGMTRERLVRLTGIASAVTWTGEDAIIRITAPDRAALRAAISRLAPSIPAGADRLAGEQRPGWRSTHALAIVATPDAPAALPGSGVRVGVDRDGNPLFVRIPPRRSAPVRIIAIGADAAARSFVESAAEAGIRVAGPSEVTYAAATERSPAEPASGTRTRHADGRGAHRSGAPLVLTVIHRPNPTDVTALRNADVVLCQPLPAIEAAVVAAALGLSSTTGEWLTRIGSGMVAVVADGLVRWAVMPPAAGVPRARRS